MGLSNHSASQTGWAQREPGHEAKHHSMCEDQLRIEGRHLLQRVGGTN